MSAWEIARRSGWSTRAVIAAALLAVLLVAAVPAALLAGIILMLGFGAFEVWIDRRTCRRPTLPTWFFADGVISMTML